MQEVKKKFNIPHYVSHVTHSLTRAGYEAYLIGGCVRDLYLNKQPKDWDITTNALPEQIMDLFEHSYYENNFGTVGVVCDDKNDNKNKEKQRIIEITTYREESTYTNKRHPDSVKFSKKLEHDVKRRDFTSNALAYDVTHETILDYNEGIKHIDNKKIIAVGDPVKRFREDALRMLRAVRFVSELNFSVSRETSLAIKASSNLLKNVSKERIRDELVKIIQSDNAVDGIILAHELGILQYILPELERGMGVEQNQAHKYDVWNHNLKSLGHAVSKNWNLDIRLSALLHDIGKPHVREWSKKKNEWSFHGHEVVGARFTRNILKNLKFSNEITEKVTKLVRWHMFFSDPEKITHSAVRRMIKNVGIDNVWALMDLRACDRIGTGRPKENPYRFRKYKAMIEEVMRDPISVKMLKTDGNKLIKLLKIKPGPRMGHLLHALLEVVLEDPKLNTEDYLHSIAMDLNKLNDDELLLKGNIGRAKKDTEDELNIKKIRRQHHVD